MQWSPEQDRALQAVSRWLRDPNQQVFRLFGYAGTGKTSLAMACGADVHGQVLYGAYTGKAAHVLHKRGCIGASTIHSMIYISKDGASNTVRKLEDDLKELWARLHSENPEADLSYHPQIQELKAKIEMAKKMTKGPSFSLNTEFSPVKDAALVVIDECSMVDEQMGKDLLSFKKKVLVLGDPAQLPPIMGGGFFTSGQPDFMLTEIHRQARDNPIIELARIVRTGGNLRPGTYGNSRVMDVSGSNAELAMAADQILVGRNATRKASNNRMRALLGRNTDSLPVVGDRLVCLRNNRELGLLNGSLWDVKQIIDTTEWVEMVVSPDGIPDGIPVQAWKNHFLMNAPEIAPYERRDAEEFDYGYALTVHKAQGSQWGNVLLYDEWFNRDTRQKWLYTAITRAAERIDIVQMG